MCTHTHVRTALTLNFCTSLLLYTPTTTVTSYFNAAAPVNVVNMSGTAPNDERLEVGNKVETQKTAMSRQNKYSV